MSILEDAAKLFDLGADVLSGKKNVPDLIDEAAANAGFGEKVDTTEIQAKGKAIALKLLEGGAKCDDNGEEPKPA